MNRLENLPTKVGLVVYHLGLNESEAQTAQQRGYKLVDVRLLEGLEQVERAIQAALMGTATLSDDQIAALRLANDIFKNRPSGSAKSDSQVKGQDDATAILGKIPRSKAFAKAAKEAAKQPPSRQPERLADFGTKPGRPVGSVTKPRQDEKTAEELEQEAIDKAFDAVAQDMAQDLQEE